MAINWTTSLGTVLNPNGEEQQIPIDYGLLPTLAARMGWIPPQSPDWMTAGQSGSDPNAAAIQSAQDFLKSKGYSWKYGQQGNANWNGIFDSNGNLVDSAGYTPNPMADLRGLITTVGLPALGGAALSGAFGAAGAAPGWTSGFDLAGGGSLGGGLTAADLGGASLSFPAAGDAGFSVLPASGAAPSVFNAAKDSQLANEALGQGPSSSGPSSVNLGDLGGILQTGLGGASVADLLKKYGPTAIGALAGLDAAKNGTQTDIQKTLDPRMADLLYGSGGYLPAAQQWFNANKNGNPNMQAGAAQLQSLYTDPQLQAGYGRLQSAGLGMMGGANPFLANWTPIQQTPFDPSKYAMPSLAPGARTVLPGGGLLGGK